MPMTPNAGEDGATGTLIHAGVNVTWHNHFGREFWQFLTKPNIGLL